MNNRPVGGRSSETSSHPIDINIIHFVFRFRAIEGRGLTAVSCSY
jgi:hypothetical protein